MKIPLRPMAPLSSVAVPPVFGIEGLLADKTAAIQLGKALFWDMQAGSDDIQACASCHFNAGADSRAMNIVNPGQPGGDNTFQLGPEVKGVIGPNSGLTLERRVLGLADTMMATTLSTSSRMPTIARAYCPT